MPVNTDKLSDIYGTNKASPESGMQTGPFEYQEGKNLTLWSQLTLLAHGPHIFELDSTSASKSDR